MTDEEKFTVFKKRLIEENHKKHGSELIEKYGEEAISASDEKLLAMTEEEHKEVQRLDRDILYKLGQAVKEGRLPKGQAGKEIVSLHKKWLSHSLKSYTPDMHKGVAQIYTEDKRFTEYYDKTVPGCALFLREAILHWAGKL